VSANKENLRLIRNKVLFSYLYPPYKSLGADAVEKVSGTNIELRKFQVLIILANGGFMQSILLQANNEKIRRTKLRIQSGWHEPITVEFKDRVTIGREFFSRFQLNDSYACLRHALIEQRYNGVFIRDLRTPQGTYVNSARVIESQIRHHDRIRIGQTDLIFECESTDEAETFFLSTMNKDWAQKLEQLPGLAQSPHPILIQGPSGTGKEMLALQIHRKSKRSLGPFLSVNCSALAETLTESELFGHIKGSFTGANEDRRGAFESARGGTLFLDEIGDLPISLQPKLLRALENNEIKPVGSDQTKPIDVRIVAATNQNLRDLIDAGQFRKDLFFRLHVLQLNPPALEQRMEDFDRILHYYAKPLRVRFTASALNYLKTHRWPGNIRELKNAISRAAALYPDQAITELEVIKLIDQKLLRLPNKKIRSRATIKRHKYLEREEIIEKLMHYGGNQRQTALDLCIPRSTLNDRIRRFNIDLDAILELNEDHEYSEDHEASSD